MNHRHSFTIIRKFLLCSLAAALVAGCGGDHLDPVLGNPGEVVTLPTPVVPPVTPPVTPPVVPADTTRPTVAQTVPAPQGANVAVNRSITALFSENMNPATIVGSNFTVRNTTTSAPVAGAVAYSVASRTATFTPAADLPYASQFTATVTMATTDVAGNALAGTTAALPNASDYTWNFSTGLAPDTTRPTVTTIVPGNEEANVPVNRSITALFNEPMNAETVIANFSVRDAETEVPVIGAVTYDSNSRTATFNPEAALPFETEFEAIITRSATDLARNRLIGNATTLPAESDYIWTFATGVAPDLTPPTVTEVFPLDRTRARCESNSVSAKFSEAMDGDSINAATFSMTINGESGESAGVSYDPGERQAVSENKTFFPTDSTIVVTLNAGAGGVKDLAGNPLAEDYVWTFTAGSDPCPAGVDLRSVEPYAAFGGSAGMTNQGTLTRILGNLGTTAVCTKVTGFRDGGDTPFTVTPSNEGLVNGGIYCAPPDPGTLASLAAATQALADAELAYNELKQKPTTVVQAAGLGGLTLAPGVYEAEAGFFNIINSDLTLDGGGDPDAVWVFKMATTLTVGAPGFPRVVTMAGSGQARNVFWQVGSAATIEQGSEMKGTAIAATAITISTAGTPPLTVWDGRAIALTASVTMVDTVINIPGIP